jgi:hypothetical protein
MSLSDKYSFTAPRLVELVKKVMIISELIMSFASIPNVHLHLWSSRDQLKFEIFTILAINSIQMLVCCKCLIQANVSGDF